MFTRLTDLGFKRTATQALGFDFGLSVSRNVGRLLVGRRSGVARVN